MYHTIIVVGNVGRDAESRYTPQGKQVTSFSVAVNDGYGDNKRTIWFSVAAWEKLAEICSQYVKKGMKVLVEGRLTADKDTGGPRIWGEKDNPRASFEVTASTVRFLSSRDMVDEATKLGGVEQGDMLPPEDDIPF